MAARRVVLFEERSLRHAGGALLCCDVGGEYADDWEAILLEFEEMQREYEEEDAIGIPMSVREKYERSLVELRKRIRRIRQEHPGKRLGELLVEQGGLDQETLEWALAEQTRRGGEALLGEMMISLGLVGDAALREALRAQTGMKWAKRRDG